MTKNIDWLKEEVNKALRDMESDGISYYDYMVLKRSLNELINQLDEPEVLSQKWIDEHAEHYEYIGYAGVPIDHLQNLLVPEQEVNLKIQELIEKYEQEDGEHSNPENAWIDDFIYDLKSLIEKEQKYYVVDNSNRNLLYKHKSNVMGELEASYRSPTELVEIQLTEQEIKDYDPRYWAFRKPVEELEE